MAIEVKIPVISEGVDTAEVIEVLVSEGDSIEKDQSIIAVETDKASVEVPSSHSGKVKEIKVKEGDEVKVNDVILILEEEQEEDPKEEEEEPAADEDSQSEKEGKAKDKKTEKDPDDETGEKETKKDKNGTSGEKKEKGKAEEDQDEQTDRKEGEEEESGSKSKKKEKAEEDPDEQTDEKAEKEESGASSEKKEEEKDDEQKAAGKTGAKSDKESGEDASDVPASPAVRRLAREIGVDIASVEGSGPGGRITEEDVKSRSKGKEGKSPKQADLPDFSKWGTVERQPLSGIRKATAKNTQASWTTIPHVFQFDEADVSGIEEYMDKNKDKAEEAGGKLTITAVLVKVLASALQQFPQFNASIDMDKEEVVLKKYYHIGIAVDTDKGLLIPVVRDVDRKTIIELAVELTELSEKARQGNLSPEEMQGGNSTISNLGGIGGTQFTPIVYPPQVAILGVSRAKVQPVYVDGDFVPRQLLPLSLSYDHRQIDGADGARFLRWICQALEDPYKALLGA